MAVWWRMGGERMVLLVVVIVFLALVSMVVVLGVVMGLVDTALKMVRSMPVV